MNSNNDLEELMKLYRKTVKDGKNNKNLINHWVKIKVSKILHHLKLTKWDDQSIIIKEAQKDGLIVIMDQDHYKEIVIAEFQNESFHQL